MNGPPLISHSGLPELTGLHSSDFHSPVYEAAVPLVELETALCHISAALSKEIKHQYIGLESIECKGRIWSVPQKRH